MILTLLWCGVSVGGVLDPKQTLLWNIWPDEAGAY